MASEKAQSFKQPGGRKHWRKRYSWGSTRDHHIILERKAHRRTRSNLYDEFELQNFGSNSKFPEPLGERNLGLKISQSTLSLDLTPEDEKKDDSFQREVAKKTQQYLIGRLEAEIEVAIDRIVEKQGGYDKALLWVVANLMPEFKVHTYVNILLHQGASPSAADDQQRTALHYAVQNGYITVTQRLLKHKALPHARDKEGVMPLTTALKNGNDELASLLLDHMSNRVVRSLFSTHDDSPTEFSCHSLIESGMKKTVLSLLDCLIEQTGTTSKFRVFYQVLEGDVNGRAPSHENFEEHSKSCLQLIAKYGDKDIVYHDVVRLLLRKKWKDFAKWRFQMNAVLFLLLLFSMTYSLVTACYTPNPAHYDLSALQLSRAVFEVITGCSLVFTFIVEINQMRKNRLDYWRDQFNWLDISSVILLLAVIPLRFLHQNAQWYLFSVGYLIWTIRVFKYATIFRQIGAYAQILWNILSHDFIQFMAVFFVIVVAFSGAFVLALKGEYMETLQASNETNSANLQYWDILFVAARTMIEGEAVLEYTGPNSFGIYPTILMVVFLFMCLVVMLNILIAQLSDTYQNVQSDAQRGLELNRAWIVARVERNSIFVRKPYRIRYYLEVEEITNPKDVLEKWESPALNDMNKALRELRDRMESTELYMMTMKGSLARQEHSLHQLEQMMNVLIEQQAAGESESETIKDSSDRGNIHSDSENYVLNA